MLDQADAIRLGDSAGAACVFVADPDTTPVICAAIKAAIA
jgi:hypothetical protein